MTLRDLGFFLRGRLNQGVTRLLNVGQPPSPPPAPLHEVLRDGGGPLALARLVAGRSNAEREAAVAAYLMARGVEFVRHRFASFEGRGENFSVDLGTGERVRHSLGLQTVGWLALLGTSLAVALSLAIHSTLVHIRL